METIQSQDPKAESQEGAQVPEAPKKSKVMWRKLKGFLLDQKKFEIREQNILEGLFEKQRLEGCIAYRAEGVEVRILEQKKEISIAEINEYNQSSVDSTGVQLWPAEELLAYFLLRSQERYLARRSFIELGAGYSGLAGVLLSKLLARSGAEALVEITDGNEICSAQLTRNIELNALGASTTARQLVWSLEPPTARKFDVVLIADCLFFKNYHEHLARTLSALLADDGECLIIAPQRGDSQQLFLAKLDAHALDYEHLQFQDATYQALAQKIRTLDSYDADKHEFSFLRVTHRKP